MKVFLRLTSDARPYSPGRPPSGLVGSGRSPGSPSVTVLGDHESRTAQARVPRPLSEELEAAAAAPHTEAVTASETCPGAHAVSRGRCAEPPAPGPPRPAAGLPVSMSSRHKMSLLCLPCREHPCWDFNGCNGLPF